MSTGGTPETVVKYTVIKRTLQVYSDGVVDNTSTLQSSFALLFQFHGFCVKFGLDFEEESLVMIGFNRLDIWSNGRLL
jgi:hypothetical protein